MLYDLKTKINEKEAVNSSDAWLNSLALSPYYIPKYLYLFVTYYGACLDQYYLKDF